MDEKKIELHKKILDLILKTKKYKHIYRPTIERIIEDLSKRFPEKILEKEVRKKLHQVWGAYFIRPNFEKLMVKVKDEVENAHGPKVVVKDLLRLQTSTNERYPILDEFYTKIFEVTGLPKDIVEYGCGVNALSYPWINRGIKYVGYDVDSELISFMNDVFKLIGLASFAEVRLGDVLINDYPEAEMYMLLKVLVLFERQEKGSSLDILRAIPSKFIVVSFPTLSITGINRGMKENYINMFTSLLKDEPWELDLIEFNNEIVFVINKS